MFRLLLFFVALSFLQSCQSPDEKYRILTVEGEHFSSTYTYNSSDQLIHILTEQTENKEWVIEYDFEYNSSERLQGLTTTSTLDGKQSTKRSTYLYDENDELTEVHEGEFDSNSTPSKYTLQIFRKEGQLAGYDMYADTTLMAGYRWSDFRKGNFHKQTYFFSTFDNGHDTIITEFEYDNKCNPFKGTSNSLLSKDFYNENNVIASRSYQRERLVESSDFEFEYDHQMPVSYVMTDKEGHKDTRTFTYATR